MILDDDFSASMVKISRFNVGNLRNMIAWYIAQGHHDHFEPKNSKPSKIGVASHEVCVAEAKVGGAATPPTE